MKNHAKKNKHKTITRCNTNNLLQVKKAECHYKSSSRIDEISSDTFLENLQFLCEAGVFADAIGWHYEINHKINDYILETGRYIPIRRSSLLYI